MLLFDMDGTLIDSNGVWKDVDREFLARRGLPYTREYYEGVAHTILPLAAKFTKEFCRLEESCGDIIAEWMAMARDAYAHVTVKPGVRAYLEQCRAEGKRMAVVTSSVPEHCRTALTRLDLMGYFEGVTFAHDLGLGTVIMGVFDRKRLQAYLEIPQDQELMALIAVGHPAEVGPAPKRKDVDVLLSWR